MRALCLCGCGRRVKKACRKYASQACIPPAVKRAAGQLGNRVYAFTVRRRIFEREIRQISGRQITREDLLVVFARIAKRNYLSGYNARMRHEDRARGRRLGAGQ